MAQIINTNIASLNAQRNLNNSQSANSTALERLSSGLRINSAKDDAAGLAISTKFESQTRGLNQAIRNAGDGISLAQTAEGALGSMTDNLQRVRELAVQSANATNSDEDRVALQQEVSALVAEITRTADETNFNGRNLFDGDFNGTFQIGANAGQTVDVQIGELTAGRLGSSSQSGVSATGVNEAISNGDLSINGVSILASQATDDTASTANAANSSISKAAAINKASNETGVEAFVNENVAVGTKMAAATEDGTLELNGVSIDIQTSTDTAGSRASVAEAINAVADQTGVRAVDTGSDSRGVQLVAEDGRNIEITFSGFSGDTQAAEATGLAKEGVYVGGYTLVSNDGPIEIDGGDGSGIGDLSNTGLSAGTYDRGVASVTTDATNYITTEGTLAGDGSIFNSANDTATTAIALAHTYSVDIDGESTPYQLAATVEAQDAVAIMASTINAAHDDITVWEQYEETLTVEAAAVAGDEFVLDGETFTLASNNAAGLADLTDQINTRNFGTALEVTATYDETSDVDGINITIRNFASDAVDITTNEAGNFTLGTAQDLDGTTSSGTTVTGELKYISNTGKDVNVSLSRDDLGTGTDDLLLDTSTYNVDGTAYKAPNGLDEGDLVINGVSIKSASGTEDTASAVVASDGSTILSSSKTASAISIAATINDVSESTGVTAEVQATKVVGSSESSPDADTEGFEIGDQAELFINGVNLGNVTLADNGTTIDTDKAKADAINLINQSSGKTGVVAVDNGSSITLEAADGRNISVAINDKSGNTDSATGIGSLMGLYESVKGIGEAVFGDSEENPTGVSIEGLTYETTVGKIKLSSASQFEVSVGTNGKEELDAMGFQAGMFGGGEDGQFLKDVDISTFEGAQLAITAIDNALETVASQRAELGALQNRFESTVSNLAITAENLTAANSRIRDADFAAETAELSRTQVLQQAGISILAQANQRPQQVLSLLG